MMKHRVYTMNAQAWENGLTWDEAIYNNQLETVEEFDTIEEATEYFENELGGDAEKYGVE